MPDLYGKRDLTEKEMKVIKLLATGMKNKDIAEELGTTEHMIKNYLRKIFDKLGFSNRVELALWYVHNFDSKG